jgi:crotonobetainyl-CoA:carnitine CoA-transferase CaiB-like acyl-CoA transferase
VIKVEGPGNPDGGRGLYGNFEPNPYFEAHNRGKRGILVDFKHPEGRETILRLAEKADVFVQNFRQGVMERLGLGYDDVRARNETIIYASASGYGPKGPHRHWAAFDILGQARGGTLSVQGPPHVPPVAAFGGMADQVGGMFLSYGVLLAIIHRARTGQGQMVDASLMGGQIALQSHNITATLFHGLVPARREREDAEPLWNIYECSDGRHVCLAMLQSDKWWPDFLEAIDQPALAGDARFGSHRDRTVNRHALIAELDKVFKTRDQAYWVEQLAAKHKLPVGPVNGYDQIADDPQVVANDLIVDFPHPSYRGLKMVGPAVQLSESPGRIERPAPEYGQHTEEVLLEFGFDWDEIAKLKDCGAIG